MTAHDFDRSLQEWFEAMQPRVAPRQILPNVFAVTRRVGQRRGVVGRLQQIVGGGISKPGTHRFVLTVFSAAALAIAAVGAVYLYDRHRDAEFAAPWVPTPTATPGQTLVPPRPTAWSVESVGRDWPGQPRAEPDEDPIIVSGLTGQAMCALPGDVLSSVVFNGVELCSDGPFIEDYPDSPQHVYVDSLGESALESNSFIDIRAVGFREECWFKPATCVDFDVVQLVERPLPHPQEQWIAFGLVADTDRDGRPDLRYGVDNAPAPFDAPLATEGRQRMWRANLPTDELDYYTAVFEVPSVMQAFFPGDLADGYGPTTGSIDAHREGASPFRFYVWASLIRDGQVVATDYAPDAGWLEAE